MSNKSVWNKKIKYIEKINDYEIAQFELYSVIVSMILSREEFKSNIDLKEFFDELKIETKPYIFKSRTVCLGKIVRAIEKAGKEDISFYLSVIKNRIGHSNNSISDTKNENTKDNNYMKGIMKKYARKNQ